MRVMTKVSNPITDRKIGPERREVREGVNLIKIRDARPCECGHDRAGHGQKYSFRSNKYTIQKCLIGEARVSKCMCPKFKDKVKPEPTKLDENLYQVNTGGEKNGS